MKEYTGAAEVKSCHKIGDAITDAEDYGTSLADLDYSATLDEVWKCAVKQRDASSEFVDTCYLIAAPNFDLTFVFRRVRCESVGQGCPLGGRQDGEEQEVLLGRVLDPTWVYEHSLGNDPPFKTVRVEVSYQETEGAKEHCGYLNVRVPIADDADDPSHQPRALAAKMIETQWTDDPHYSFSYRLIDD